MGKQHCRALGQSVVSLAGKKQDTWFIVDPKSGEKQTTLSTEAWDGVCPSSPLLYIGRTRKAALPPPPSGSQGVLGCSTTSMGAAAVWGGLCDCCQQQALLSIWKWQKSRVWFSAAARCGVGLSATSVLGLELALASCWQLLGCQHFPSAPKASSPWHTVTVLLCSRPRVRHHHV